jgi:hypothetical protein
MIYESVSWFRWVACSEEDIFFYGLDGLSEGVHVSDSCILAVLV